MMLSSNIAKAALLAIPALVSAYDFPLPGTCTGYCTGLLHDPSVVYNGNGTYYRFVTDNEVGISTAPSIAGPWTDVGRVLPNGSSINLPGRYDIWAPDCFEFDGTYYLYYAVSTGGSQNSDIGVATSTSMKPGTWTDHGSIG
jgi:arabinan endo-1,5-alpha-L-arabinosidase